jgi:uncharacterized protein with HEPN domain
VKQPDRMFYVMHMLECIANVEEDTAHGREAFFRNRTLRDAVMRNLQLLGESSKRVPELVKVQFPDVPWTDLADFRNVAVHDYMRIDLDEIWRIVESDVPPLKEQLQRIADEMRQP